jgi:tripartite-type tricarboxylate transporter receptor subunit TctC
MHALARLFGLALVLGSLLGTAALGQQYPKQGTIKIVVPFGPGGGTDTIARLVAAGMSEALGQNIVIENRGGAGTVVGATQVARANPDGYTLLVTVDQTMTMNPYLYSKLSYDPERDFEPVAMLGAGPRVYVSSPQVPAKTFREFLDYAKANPGKLNYSSGAITGRVLGEHLMEVSGTKMLFIPFGSGPAALTALLSNEIQFVMADIGTFGPPARDGRLVGLAVSTSKRAPSLPDVPTLAELGYGNLENAGWWGLFAPAGTPQPIIQALNDAVRKATAQPTAQERMKATGNEFQVGSPEELRDIVKRESAKWGPVITKAGIKAD